MAYTPEQIKDAYVSVFKGEGSKIVLDDMAQRFCMYSPTFVPDSNETIFREGQRSVLLFINSMLTAEKRKQKIQEEES